MAKELTAVVLDPALPPVTFFSQAPEKYGINTEYYLQLSPPAGFRVELTFFLFQTEANYDLLTIFSDGAMNATLFGPLGGAFSPLPSSSVPALIQGAPSSSPVIKLSTDGSDVFSGLGFVASLACADPACASVPIQPSVSPAPPSPSPSNSPSSSSTPSATASPLRCGPGTYASLGYCALCPAGSYSREVGATQCPPCPSGTVSAPGSTQCIAPCPSGQVVSGSACAVCPANTYSQGGSTTSCTTCRAFFSAPSGSAACSPPSNSAPMANFSNLGLGITPAVESFVAPALALSPSDPPLLLYSQPQPTYAHSTTYYATLQPPLGFRVEISFKVFSTESSNDYVSVYSFWNASGKGPMLLPLTSGPSISLPTVLPGTPNAAPVVTLATDSSVAYSGIILLASLVCAEASCASAPSQPSTSPLPSFSPTPSSSVWFSGGPPLGGQAPGGGGGSSAATSSADMEAGPAAGVAIGVLGVLAVSAGISFLLFRSLASNSKRPMLYGGLASPPRFTHALTSAPAGEAVVVANPAAMLYPTARPPPGRPPQFTAV
jgi:hypothetical protein